MTTELKPCPFCGDEVTMNDTNFDRAEIRPDAETRFWFVCTNSKCLLGDEGTGIIRGKDDAIAAWNNRAVPPGTIPAEKVREIVAELRAEIPENEIISDAAACVFFQCMDELDAMLRTDIWSTNE